MRWKEAFRWKVRGNTRNSNVQYTKLGNLAESPAYMVKYFYCYIILMFPWLQICYQFIFIFYYHCHFMCSWNIDCQCTLYYADENLIYIYIYMCVCVFHKRIPALKFKYLLNVRGENCDMELIISFFYLNPRIHKLWLLTIPDM
jgi:hypothetical protein